MTDLPSQAPAGFHIMMPPGWMRFAANDDGKRALIALTSARMKALGRPDLDAQSRTLIEVQWRQLIASKSTAVYLPGERDDEVLTPMSIAVKQLVAPPASTFDAAISSSAHATVERISGPDGAVYRWVQGQSGVDELAEVRSQLIGYGFPLPGDKPRRGLLFVTSIPYLVDTEATMIEALVELSDTIMETFRWR